MHKTRWRVAIAVLWLSTACNKSPSQPTSTLSGQGPTPQSTTPTVTSVSISGPTRVALGESVRYTALAHFSDLGVERTAHQRRVGGPSYS